MPRTLCRVIWIPSCIAVFAMVVMFARQPLALPPPTEMTAFTSEDKVISVKHPGNWKAHSNSIHGNATEVWFEPIRNASFAVNADLAGSLMADIAKSGNNMASNLLGDMPGGTQIKEKMKSPLETMHEVKAAKLTKELLDYQEGGTTKATLGGLEAMVTEFTFKKPGMWGPVEMSGKRATAIHSERRISVFSYCPKPLESQLIPVYNKIMATLRFGSEGG